MKEHLTERQFPDDENVMHRQHSYCVVSGD